MATAIFGGFTPYLAQVLIARTGWPMLPGVMIAVVAVAVLPVLIMLPETARLRREMTEALAHRNLSLYSGSPSE